MRYLGVQSTVIDEVFASDGRGGGAAYADATAPDPWADVPRVNTLLTDGTSPLYEPASPLALQDALERALIGLGG